MQSKKLFGVARPAEARSETRRWSLGLEAVAKRIDRHFARAEVRGRLRAYLRGLLSPVERKNSWQLAEALGDRTPHGVQHLLGRAEWSADAPCAMSCSAMVRNTWPIRRAHPGH